jgi:hypothetical protein
MFPDAGDHVNLDTFNRARSSPTVCAREVDGDTTLCYSSEIIAYAVAASRGRFERVEALQHPHYLRCRPLAFAARGRNLPRIQAICNGTQ